MKITRTSINRGFILGVALLSGICFVPPASAESYLIDLKASDATRLGVWVKMIPLPLHLMMRDRWSAIP